MIACKGSQVIESLHKNNENAFHSNEKINPDQNLMILSFLKLQSFSLFVNLHMILDESFANTSARQYIYFGLRQIKLLDERAKAHTKKR